MRPLLWIALALVALGFYLDRTWSIRLSPGESAAAVTGLELIDLAGRPVALEDYRGQVVLLNLWASWCAPCRAEIPGLSHLAGQLASRGLVVLGVNVESLSADRLAEIGDRLGITYPILVPAHRGPLGSLGSAETLPRTWLIDRQGRLRATHVGWAPTRSFRRACDRLLDESSWEKRGQGTKLKVMEEQRRAGTG